MEFLQRYEHHLVCPYEIVFAYIFRSKNKTFSFRIDTVRSKHRFCVLSARVSRNFLRFALIIPQFLTFPIFLIENSSYLRTEFKSRFQQLFRNKYNLSSLNIFVLA